MPGLRNNRILRVTRGEKSLCHQWDLPGSGIAYDLCQQSYHIVNISSRTQTAVVPCGEDGSSALGISGFVFRVEACAHGSSESIYAGHEQGIKYIIERVSIRSSCYHSSCGCCLVV